MGDLRKAYKVYFDKNNFHNGNQIKSLSSLTEKILYKKTIWNLLIKIKIFLLNFIILLDLPDACRAPLLLFEVHIYKL